MTKVHNYYTGTSYGKESLGLIEGNEYVGITVIEQVDGVLLYDPDKKRLIFTRDSEGVLVPPIVTLSENDRDPQDDEENATAISTLNTFVKYYDERKFEKHRVIPRAEIHSFMNNVKDVKQVVEGEVQVRRSLEGDKVIVLKSGVRPKVTLNSVITSLDNFNDGGGSGLYSKYTHRKFTFINPYYIYDSSGDLTNKGIHLIDDPDTVAVIVYFRSARTEPTFTLRDLSLDQVVTTHDNETVQEVIIKRSRVAFETQPETFTPSRTNFPGNITGFGVDEVSNHNSGLPRDEERLVNLIKMIDERVRYDANLGLFIIDMRNYSINIDDVINIIVASNLMGKKIINSKDGNLSDSISLSGRVIESRIRILTDENTEGVIIGGGKGFTVDDVYTILSQQKMDFGDTDFLTGNIDSVYSIIDDVSGDDDIVEDDKYYHRDGVTVHDAISYPTFYRLNKQVLDKVPGVEISYDGIFAGFLVTVANDESDEYYIGLVNSTSKLVILIDNNKEVHDRFIGTGNMPKGIKDVAETTNETFYIDSYSVDIPEAIIAYILDTRF